MSINDKLSVVTVTVNPAIDQTLIVPGFQAGEVNLARQVHTTAGGKGVNVAAFLADFQIPAEATGFLGRGNQAIFTDFLESKGVVDRFVRLPGDTRTGIKIVDDTTQTTTDINLPGLKPEASQVDDLLATLKELESPGRWFVLAGSLPAGAPPDLYATLIRQINQGGGRVALDTSGEALRHGLRAGPALVKPNIDELRAFCGRSMDGIDDVVRAARELVATGIRTVVVSMGEKGAVFVEDGSVLFARPPKVTVLSTVGAGDAMVSGMVAGAVKNLSLAERARLGTAFSLNAVTSIGAGLTPEAVETYAKQVTVSELAG
jgi:1-phosphofructokinase